MDRTLGKALADGERCAFVHALLAALLLAIVLVPASAAYAQNSTGASLTAFSDDATRDAYVGGTIPILRLTFNDDVDPETGDVILSGDEKIVLMNEAPNHSYKATGVTLDLEVPSAYDNPEDDMWDGLSGYAGETGLELESISMITLQRHPAGKGCCLWAGSRATTGNTIPMKLAGKMLCSTRRTSILRR